MVQDAVVAPPGAELHAAILQAVLTVGLAGLALLLHHRYRAAYFGWFAAGWGLYALRLSAIIVFLLTGDWIWLFWHQVITGWMALTLLWAALVFSRRARLRPIYLAAALFPLVWSYLAIYRLDNFLLAALPAVLFLSLTTLATGWIFLRHWRQVRSLGALALAAALIIWGLHHLDYPFLRARGAWIPWGYYLDIVFTLSVATGMLLLVQDDLESGLKALLTLAADLQGGRQPPAPLDLLLERPLTLPAVRGAALFAPGAAAARCVQGSGACAGWAGREVSGAEAATILRCLAEGRPAFPAGWRWPDGTSFAFAAILPLFRESGAREALAIVADARVPFTALDERFLVALGQQIGAAIEHADLTSGLQSRTADLERLQQRMVAQHEEERRRVSLHLHDETAQLFTAVKIQLGLLREQAPGELRERLTAVIAVLDDGLASIRNVTNDLRPSLLDDLGLVPALRSLAAGFERQTGLSVDLETGPLPAVSEPTELVLYRALQESLSNVAEHAHARRVSVRLGAHERTITLEVQDDGRGFADVPAAQGLERAGHLGLAGMRERIVSLGGSLQAGNGPGGGARIVATVPGNES